MKLRLDRPDPRREDGWIAVTAIVLITIMLGVGLAAAAYVDRGTVRTKEQRERESSLTLAEGTLYAQGFALARNWPSATTAGYPSTCSSSTTYLPGTVLARQCPDRATLGNGTGGTFTSVDFADASRVTWTTRVRDNGPPLNVAYDRANADAAQGACAAPCTRDFNRDNTLWVEARAVVRGKPRNVVALLKLERLMENVPRVAVTAGALNITNSGNNQKIDNTGSQVILRCDVASTSCANWRDPEQIKPTAPLTGSPPSMLTGAQIERFRDTARTAGTYYDVCTGMTPPAGGKVLTEIFPAPVIFLENCTNPGTNFLGSGHVTCAPPNGLDPNCVNSRAAPGVLIVRCGAIRMAGNWTFAGVIYLANGSDNDPSRPCAKRGTTPPTCSGSSLSNEPNGVFDTQGGFGVWGGLAADGNACVMLGSNGFQVSYERDMFNGFQSLGTVGLVQNTWRELPPR